MQNSSIIAELGHQYSSMHTNSPKWHLKTHEIHTISEEKNSRSI